MDLFLYNPTYQIWVCTAPRCRYAVAPSVLLTHLRTRHGSHPSAATPALREAALAAMLQRPWIDPAREASRFPAKGDPPVPGLPVYRGHACPHCPYITRSFPLLDEHRSKKHKEQDGCWRPGRLSIAERQARGKARLAARPVSCQRFYITRAGSYFFEVSQAMPAGGCQEHDTARIPQDPAELIRARVNQALQEGEAAAELANGQVPAIDPHPTEASPWLELTRWPEYLRGQDLTA
ncbi:hypothetical protein BDW62DRAFT_206027, partial [Aspergillus aurantiobrunneus]